MDGIRGALVCLSAVQMTPHSPDLSSVIAGQPRQASLTKGDDNRHPTPLRSGPLLILYDRRGRLPDAVQGSHLAPSASFCLSRSISSQNLHHLAVFP
jgi:hypothetical protein